ncbi:hypothetical protein DN597_27300, partial [Enterobacter cloacae]
YYTIKWCLVFLLCLSIYSALKVSAITAPIPSIFIALYISLFFSILVSIYWYLTVTKKYLMERAND